MGGLKKIEINGGNSWEINGRVEKDRNKLGNS
jgi:hypothetical protein